MADILAWTFIQNLYALNHLSQIETNFKSDMQITRSWEPLVCFIEIEEEQNKPKDALL